MIDIHTHIGIIFNKEQDISRKGLSASQLVDMLNEQGIDKACVLPIISPETSIRTTDTEYVLNACRSFPDRLIPFANIDPRSCGNNPQAEFRWILESWKNQGCAGLGEVTANIAFDDPRMINLLKQCGEFDLPVTFHMTATYGDEYGLVDTPGMPGLEKALQVCPDTIIVGHSPAFWREIGSYSEGDPVTGMVQEGGRISELFDTYTNLYGDLSANSGFTAISRDSAFTAAFFAKYAQRLMFATDYLEPDQEMPIIPFLRDFDMDDTVRMQIYEGTAKEIYGI